MLSPGHNHLSPPAFTGGRSNTLIVMESIFTHWLASVPETKYVNVSIGQTSGLFDVVLEMLVVVNQLYVTPPEAVICVVSPKHKSISIPASILGKLFTVIFISAVSPQLLVPTT